jgi:uncharacterized protein (DUF2147 family)
MKKPLRPFLSTLLALLSFEASAEEAIHGIWLRGGRQEKLEFFDCEGKLCARGVIPAPDGSPPALILRYAAKTSPNQWKGELFNPENGKTYSGTITLDNPKQLTLTGCLIAFLCQSETWTKVPKDTVPPPAPASAQKGPPPSQKSPPAAQKAPVPAQKNPPPAH